MEAIHIAANGQMRRHESNMPALQQKFTSRVTRVWPGLLILSVV